MIEILLYLSRSDEEKKVVIKKLYHILLIAAVFICGITETAFSQAGFFIPGTGKIFFTGDSSTIFSNVINRGKFGIGKNAVVNFTGRVWENDPLSMMTTESNNGQGMSGEAGWLRFLSDSVRQQILGGYNSATGTGASFSKIKVDNKLGVELIDGSASIRDEVNFTSGRFYLNDQVLVIGNKGPGKITGYDSSRFFVTANQPNLGFLIRKNMRNWDGLVVFPIGTADGSYTPAGVRAFTLRARDYYATVFDSVLSGGGTGTSLRDQSVNKTWQIGKSGSPHLGKVDIELQHLIKDEGTFFAGNRRFAYVSRFKNGGWDEGYPQSTPGIGYMTTGARLTNSGLNKRIFSTSLLGSNYFTKFTSETHRSIVTALWFNAYRLDTGAVKVYWKTNPEINVKTFVVQRRLSNETAFKDVSIVPSQALNGYSISNLNYTINDPNNYRGISFYRLMMVPYTGVNTYSDTVAVGSVPGIYSIMLWPNPTPDVFYVSIHKTLPAKSIIIWNVLGQKLKEEPVNGRSIIQLGGLLPGTYLVSVVLTNNEIIETKKLLVLNR